MNKQNNGITRDEVVNILKSTFSGIKKGKKEEESDFLEKCLDRLHNSKFMKALSTSTALGSFAGLVLGSDLLLSKFNLNEAKIKQIRETIIFGILGLLLTIWGYTLITELYNKLKQPNNKHEEPEIQLDTQLPSPDLQDTEENEESEIQPNYQLPSPELQDTEENEEFETQLNYQLPNSYLQEAKITSLESFQSSYHEL